MLTSKQVWKLRYALKGETKITDTFRRVAKALSDNPHTEGLFYNVMKNLEFLPAGRVLANAGLPNAVLFNCAVIPLEDSMESIMRCATEMALLWKAGCGVGVNVSPLRPAGSKVKGARGTASGPVSFVDIFDAVAATIKQGGNRRAALMVVMNDNHPDLLDFIKAKANDNVRWTNANISVAFTDDPRKCSKFNVNRIAETAAIWAEPGVLFLKNIRSQPGCENVTAVNPCGESNLPPYQFCDLGSVNLKACWENSKSEYDFYERVYYATLIGFEMLDAVYDHTEFVLPAMKENSLKDRRLGLGMMGLADLFLLREVRYGSPEALSILDKVLQMMHKAAENWKVTQAHRGKHNVTLFSQAPTGSIAHLAGCSSGIEPIFHFVRKEKIGDTYEGYVHPIYDRYYRKRKPDWLITAEQVTVEEHLEIQTLVQKYFDQAVSKTLWLPRSMSEEEAQEKTKSIILEAYDRGLKGLTIWWEGGRRSGAIRKAFRCENCGAIVESIEGACQYCSECGYGHCS